MDRMSPTDAGLCYAETENAPMQMGSVGGLRRPAAAVVPGHGPLHAAGSAPWRRELRSSSCGAQGTPSMSPGPTW